MQAAFPSQGNTSSILTMLPDEPCPVTPVTVCQNYLFIYFIGLHHAKYLISFIVTDSQKGGGNQYIQLVKVLHCKLLINGKQLPAFTLKVRPRFEL